MEKNQTNKANETMTFSTFAQEMSVRAAKLSEYRASQQNDYDSAMTALHHFVAQLAKGLPCADAIAKYAAQVQAAQYNLNQVAFAIAAPWSWELDGEPYHATTRLRPSA